MAFLDRSTISRATTSGASTIARAAVDATLSMTIGDRIRPARVPGIQSSVQNAPYRPMNWTVTRSLFACVYASGIAHTGAAMSSRSQGLRRYGPLAM